MMMAATTKATREQTKRHNNRLVLKTVYNRGLVSRADIARSTHLTATTVSATIAELMASGLVEEAGAVSTERGKPPTLINLVKDARQVIALDLSRDIFRGSILNLRGEIVQQQTFPVAGLTGNAAIAAVYAVIDRLLPQVNRPLLGIGIGAPGILDYNTGTIQQAANLGWHNFPLRDQLSHHYACVVHLINDNQATLLAEYSFGEYRTCADLVVIRIGHGIGAGLMLNHQLIHGYGVGEIGHLVVVVDNGERCTCGNLGCLETIASSRAIVKGARLLARSHPDSQLNHLAITPDDITIETVIQAFDQDDPVLLPLIANVGHYLGVAIAGLVGVLGMPQILLCGSVMRFGPRLLEMIEHEICQRSLTGRLRKPRLAMLNLGSDISDSVMRGAAASLLTHELGLF
ncbi:MAG: ROK family protein [Chloroflexota bacterium]|nr:ROK family protein [Chloroflexota bacterium]